jgi:uncharacterized protein
MPRYDESMLTWRIRMQNGHTIRKISPLELLNRTFRSMGKPALTCVAVLCMSFVGESYALCYQSAPVEAPKSVDPEKILLISTVLEQTHAESLMNQMVQQFEDAFDKNFEKSFTDERRKAGDTHDYSADIANLESKLKDLFGAFTKEELTDIVAFYRTPTGQSLLRKLPELSKRGSEIGQAQMASAGPEIQSMMQEFLESIKKKASPAQ